MARLHTGTSYYIPLHYLSKLYEYGCCASVEKDENDGGSALHLI